jgi:16S rRNA (adenine1518-N6/adenine1519-N6)-dimethyltransferase
VTADAAEPRLLGAADLRALAARLGVRPTKRLGQNFVVDANTVRRIVRESGVGADDVVLEIGPGLGSLTLGLLAVAAHVVAVELDPVLAAALPETVTERSPTASARLDVVPANALQVTSLPGPTVTAMVANLPYNVAVPVVLHVLETFASVGKALVMVQAEVADRIAAPPGSRTYGAPSAKIAWYADARRAGSISRAVFWPVPNVDSTLVRLTRRQPPSTTAARSDVFRVVDAAFGQRRKSLRAGLAGWAGSAGAAEGLLRAAGIDPGARGESLDIAAFARLAEQAATRTIDR